MPKATSSPASSKPQPKRGKSASPASKASASSTEPGTSTTGSGKAKRQRIDWEAVERDYRTGKFTLRELEAKHKASYSEISRKAKREAWQKDLRDVIRAATESAVLRDVATKAQNDTTDVVLAAAEINAQIIRSHRTRLASLTSAADQAQSRVLEMLGAAADSREVVALSGALEGLARMTKTLIDKEREAHGIDGNEEPDDARRSLPLEFIEARHAED